jgi:hypothetical protein
MPAEASIADTRHNCYGLIDEALAAKGLRLAMCFQIDRQTGRMIATPRIPVEPIDDSHAAKKAARTTNMLASNCPFCGVVLERLP